MHSTSATTWEMPEAPAQAYVLAMRHTNKNKIHNYSRHCKRMTAGLWSLIVPRRQSGRNNVKHQRLKLRRYDLDEFDVHLLKDTLPRTWHDSELLVHAVDYNHISGGLTCYVNISAACITRAGEGAQYAG